MQLIIKQNLNVYNSVSKEINESVIRELVYFIRCTYTNNKRSSYKGHIS